MVAICVSLLTRRLQASIIVREVLVVVGFADHRKRSMNSASASTIMVEQVLPTVDRSDAAMGRIG